MQSYHAVRDMKVEYSQKVDTYAFGIVLYEILTHQAPWKALTDQGNVHDVFRSVVAGKRLLVPASRREEMPAWCKLMEASWHKKPERRPSFEAALNDLRLELSLFKKQHSSTHDSPDSRNSQGLTTSDPSVTQTWAWTQRRSTEPQESYNLHIRQSRSRPVPSRTWTGSEELQEPLLVSAGGLEALGL